MSMVVYQIRDLSMVVYYAGDPSLLERLVYRTGKMISFRGWDSTMEANRPILCPSAQPDWQSAQVFGVVGGTADAPTVAYLAAPQLATDELMQLSGPVRPGEIFRIAAPCACSGC